MTQKSILITGCSSGIGLASVQYLRPRGWHIYATARKPEDLAMLRDVEKVEAIYLDYDEPHSIKACVEEVRSKTNGQLYALFNNGAWAQPGAAEDISGDLLRRQFETNVIGWHDLTVQVLPMMRAQNAGRIVHCSSILGLNSFHYRGAYSASKYAIEALADAMRQELHDTNIHISLIEPGPVKTRFIARSIAAYEDNIDFDKSAHCEIYKKRVQQMRKGGATKFKVEPLVVAKKLCHAIESKRPKTRYFVTFPTYFIAYARRLLPTSMLDKILMNN